MDQKRQLKEHATHEDAKYYHLSATRDPATSDTTDMHVIFPHSILSIENKDDLQVYLDRYSHQTTWKELTPDSEFARRWYVEKIRPAMRFYCKKLAVPIPPWLTNDDYFLKMDPTTKYECFGPNELHPIVFKKLELRDPGKEPAATTPKG